MFFKNKKQELEIKRKQWERHMEWKKENIERIKREQEYSRKKTRILLCYQHNSNIFITKENYDYVYLVKQQLLKHTTALLNELSVDFVISHGNLLEFHRGKPIYHDDDFDIRFRDSDFLKMNENTLLFEKHNLIIDSYRKNSNFYKLKLKTFHNPNEIKVFPEIHVIMDLVSHKTHDSFWIPYDVDFSNKRKILFMDQETFAPSLEDTIKVLTLDYGNDFIIPHRKDPF
jgi:hypothetical protein